MKFDICLFFENLWRKLEFHWNLTKITNTLHEDVCTFMIISSSLLLRMRNVSDKSCRENRNTHFMSKKLSGKLRRLWDNFEKKNSIISKATDDNTTRRMRFTCWIIKARDPHSKWAILSAFPLQEWLRESASILLHTYSACLV